MDQPTVLIVDDEQDYAEFVRDILENDWDITTAYDGASAIQHFKEKEHDLVLLDVNLPDKSGFDVCSAIKQLDSQDNTSIVFVSGMNTIEERITGYDAGGDDYISKPFQLGEFQSKIAKIGRYQQAKKNLTHQQEYAKSVAFESMKEASQYGQVLQFLKVSFSCNNVFTLCNSVFETLGHFQLNCCIQIRLPDQDISMRPHNRSCSPMEDELFDMLRNKGRLFEFSNRLMVNDLHASILIKNMPCEDSAEVGRLKDILAVVIEGFEARLMDLERQSGIQSVLKSLSKTIPLVKTQFKEHERRSVAVMDNLLLEMGSSLHILDLTEDQEGFFIELVQKAMIELVDVCDHGKTIEHELEQIAHLAKSLAVNR
ncbi:hypothetical protein A9Q99_03050 [Gammaproteobacteria bacterium 45_16_T64]|nr:hypothetical protein A9Q99_03050 [Gammaproteobacteria bacterium 45_16_T64]